MALRPLSHQEEIQSCQPKFRLTAKKKGAFQKKISRDSTSSVNLKVCGLVFLQQLLPDGENDKFVYTGM